MVNRINTPIRNRDDYEALCKSKESAANKAGRSITWEEFILYVAGVRNPGADDAK